MGKQSRKKQSRRQPARSSIATAGTDQLSAEEFQTGLARAAAMGEAACLRGRGGEAGDPNHRPRVSTRTGTAARHRAARQRDVDSHRGRRVRADGLAFPPHYHGGLLCYSDGAARVLARRTLHHGTIALRSGYHMAHRAGAPTRTRSRAILRLLNTYDVLGPHALRRVWVDAHRRLGVLYGVIPIMQAAADRQEPGAAAQLEETLQALVKLSWKHLPTSLRQEDPQDVRCIVASALGEVLVGRVHRSGHPLEAAIRGFNGKFEVLPVAVANVVSKDEGYRAITVAFTAADGDHLADERPTPLDVVVQQEQDHGLQQKLAWLKADPQRKAAYRALVKEQTQDDAAREAGISPPTLRKQMKALQRELVRVKPFFVNVSRPFFIKS